MKQDNNIPSAVDKMIKDSMSKEIPDNTSYSPAFEKQMKAWKSSAEKEGFSTEDDDDNILSLLNKINNKLADQGNFSTYSIVREIESGIEKINEQIERHSVGHSAFDDIKKLLNNISAGISSTVILLVIVGIIQIIMLIHYW